MIYSSDVWQLVYTCIQGTQGPGIQRPHILLRCKVGKMLLWGEAELSAIGLEVQGRVLAWGRLKYSTGGLSMQFWKACLMRAHFSDISGSSIK